jgi:hypothetical protein
MSTLHQQIAEKVLIKLAGSKEVTADQVELLRAVPADAKKLKAEEFVIVFLSHGSGDIK